MDTNWTIIIIMLLVFALILFIVVAFGSVLIRSAMIAEKITQDTSHISKQIDYDVSNIVTHIENSLDNSNVDKILNSFTNGLTTSIPAVYKSESIIIKDRVESSLGVTIDENICSFGILIGDSMLSLNNTDASLEGVNTNLQNIKEKVCN